ncbi:DUF4872 domain-containing protein [Auraticoccus sp. F435]|uniref:DUF4872 domain-containing protein n=1 Tax=Auraticoccus cholistanensis TaxID=2656650 RepID=A0A6A9UT39_9ACTN|nr:BtrH N-terminal domain-containing protein [Auraticoccus cholistanensis]MVA75798.1 DUF4872 domain-containing protein [Auraticoccus cholistanensis]
MGEQTGHGTVVDGIVTAGGVHCETSTLGVLLGHAGLSLSEPMLFGLGAGLSFIYWDSKQQQVPFLGGRVKPFVLTQNLCARLGLDLQVHETTSPTRAWEQVRSAVDRQIPVGLQLDSHDLEYFTSRVHFAGHVVALYGYDDTTAYLVDTAQQGGRVTTSLPSLARARAARGPMSARHRSFTLAGPVDQPTAADLAPAVVEAVVACAQEFLTPPIANLGNRGIRTAARRVRTWLDRVEDPARDLTLVATLMDRAGTGGALFRNLYRDFLTESAQLLDGHPGAAVVARGGDLFAESARLWTRVAELVGAAGAAAEPAHLAGASRVLDEIAEIETTAMTTLRSLDLDR